jgi:MinD-like ATPase involved in chromosome partitioning or flagellar assembly
MSAPVIAFYSYKGGAGRTVSAANIASILATELNKKIVLVDADFESAGMSIVLGVNKMICEKVSPVEYNRFALQDLLSDNIELTGSEDFMRDYWPKLAIDMSSIFNKNIPTNRFWFIPSRPATHDDVSGITKYEVRNVEKVLTYLDTEINPDMVLFDSASGLAGPAVLSLSLSHSLVTFMRWSEQFVEGTINVLSHLIENRPSIENYFLVPSAVPSTNNEEEYVDHLRRQKTRIKIELNHGGDNPVNLFDGIPESRRLKWRETILCFEERLNEEDSSVLEAYKNVALSISKI